MPTPTYDLIEEKVLSSAAPSVVFNSITGTYKDLVVEYIVQSSDTNPQDVILRFNSDTGTNYSYTNVNGTGTAAGSYRLSSVSSITCDFYGTPTSTRWSSSIINIMSYANSNVNKTVLIRTGAAASGVEAIVGLWRSTAAITSLNFALTGSSVNFAAGSTFRLYGIAG